MSRFLAAGAAFVALAAFAPALSTLPDGTRGAATIALHVALSVCLVAATAWFSADRRATWWLIAFGVAARVVAAAAPPFTSNDVYRYLWDGHVLLAGGDPWQTSPAVFPADGWPLPPDNRSIASLYPPLAMALFAACATAGPAAGLWLWKGLVLAASLATLAVCASLTRGSAQRRSWLPLVALSPLLVLEGGVGAHLDLLSALAVVAALALVRRQAFAAAGLALGLGGLVKLLPLAALLPIVAARGWRRGGWALAAAAIVVALGYAVPTMLGFAPWGSLPVFLSTWRFGGPVALLARFTGPGVTRLVGLALLSGFFALSARRAVAGGVSAGLPYALLGPLVGSPVVFPWYLAPAVAVSASAPSAVVLTWATLAPLSYEVIDRYRLTGRFEPAAWPLWLASVGLLVALVFELRLARGRAR